MQAAEPIEAVIISGPRKGTIIQLNEVQAIQPTEEELRLLDSLFVEMNSKIERLIKQFDRIARDCRASTKRLNGKSKRQ